MSVKRRFEILRRQTATMGDILLGVLTNWTAAKDGKFFQELIRAQPARLGLGFGEKAFRLPRTHAQ